MSHGHYVAKCKHDVVMSQCRCPAPDKDVRRVDCDHPDGPSKNTPTEKKQESETA